MAADELGVPGDALEGSEVVLGAGAQALQAVLLAVVAEAGDGVSGLGIVACSQGESKNKGW
jgi:hypothetical protein